MELKDQLLWHDPHQKIWGFHVHQELNGADFDRALVIQSECVSFLKSHGIQIDADDAIKPGYGPHLNYMWEIRVENDRDNVLEKMGLAISFLAINRFGMSAYVHPLMHDPALGIEECLLEQGRTNQANVLWFSYQVKQYQDFFINPPRHADGTIVDTRTVRVFTREEKDEMYSIGKSKMVGVNFKDPHEAIKFGYHIHMDFTHKVKNLALLIFERFRIYLRENHLIPTSTRIYGVNENGPHLQSGWEVKFETSDTNVLRYIGRALGWLMCNRQNLPVYVHPVTWLPGDIHEELNAHENYSMYISDLPPMNYGFFRNKII